MAKVIWAVASKQDILWVKWVHGRYLKGKSWWEYTPKPDCNWYWKRICKIKDDFLERRMQLPWHWTVDTYSVSKGYRWLLDNSQKVIWGRQIWAKANVPKCAFISWVAIQHRLPTKSRLSAMGIQQDQTCALCTKAEEDDDHLFYHCEYAKLIWGDLMHWWGTFPKVSDGQQLILDLNDSKIPRTARLIHSTIFTSALYHIWLARNEAVFKNRLMAPAAVFQLIKCQVRDRLLYINTIHNTYRMYIDRLLM